MIKLKQNLGNLTSMHDTYIISYHSFLIYLYNIYIHIINKQLANWEVCIVLIISIFSLELEIFGQTYIKKREKDKIKTI